MTAPAAPDGSQRAAPQAETRALEELLQLARDVAEHFADTDAPLGQQARDAIARAGLK